MKTNDAILAKAIAAAAQNAGIYNGKTGLTIPMLLTLLEDMAEAIHVPPEAERVLVDGDMGMPIVTYQWFDGEDVEYSTIDSFCGGKSVGSALVRQSDALAAFEKLRGCRLPKVSTREAVDAIEAMKTEYNNPSNTANCARYGWEAARRFLDKADLADAT